MLSIEFSEEDRPALLYERFHHPHPRVQIKMEALWLKSQGMEHQVITQLVGISANTFVAIFESTRAAGLSGSRSYDSIVQAVR